MRSTDFIHYAHEFLMYLNIKLRRSLHTQRAYAADLEHFMTFWQHVEATHPHLTAQEVLNRYFKLLYGERKDKRTIARKSSCFSSLCKFITTVKGQPVTLTIPRPHIEEKAPETLTEEEINRLLETPHEQLSTQYPYRDKAILEILYATGIRCCELVNIKMSQLDLTARTITIAHAKKSRVVLFGMQAQQRLADYLTYERPAGENADEFLFLNYRNAQLTTRAIQHICAMFRSVLPTKVLLTPHILRHSCAQHLLDRGADITLVQKLLGHSTLLSTEKYRQRRSDIRQTSSS